LRKANATIHTAMAMPQQYKYTMKMDEMFEFERLMETVLFGVFEVVLVPKLTASDFK